MTGPSDPDAVRPPDPRMIPARSSPPPRGGPWGHPHLWVPPRGHAVEVAGDARVASDAVAAGDAGVRPFVVTGGRTAPVDYRLRIETQVVTTPHAASTLLGFESRRIVELCRTPLAVAEIGAALGLPLGVARVLVADLAADGLVVGHQPTASESRATSERILERVHGL